MKPCEEESIGRLLYHTAQIMTVHAEKVLKPYDLTVEQLHLLKNIPEEPALSQNQLCELAQKSAANVTRILDRLERKGCIKRKKNPADRRATLLFLTNQGKELMAEVSTVLQAFSETLTTGLSTQEQETFIRLLHRIQDNLTEVAK